jgi:hypothetical protein
LSTSAERKLAGELRRRLQRAADQVITIWSRPAQRRLRGPNPRERWPSEIDELTGKLARIERAIDAERDPVRLPILRQQLAIGSAQLERLKLATMAGEVAP